MSSNKLDGYNEGSDGIQSLVPREASNSTQLSRGELCAATIFFHATGEIAVAAGAVMLEVHDDTEVQPPRDSNLRDLRLSPHAHFWMLQGNSWRAADEVDSARLTEERPDGLSLVVANRARSPVVFQDGDNEKDRRNIAGEAQSLVRLISAYALAEVILVNGTQLERVRWATSYPNSFGQNTRIINHKAARTRLELHLLQQYPALQEQQVATGTLTSIARELASPTISAGIQGIIK